MMKDEMIFKHWRLGIVTALIFVFCVWLSLTAGDLLAGCINASF